MSELQRIRSSETAALRSERAERAAEMESLEHQRRLALVRALKATHRDAVPIEALDAAIPPLPRAEWYDRKRGGKRKRGKKGGRK